MIQKQFILILLFSVIVECTALESSELIVTISNPNNAILEAYLENRGKSNIEGVIQSSARFIIELNGKYYATSDFGGKSSFMPPGRKYGPIKINISKFWKIPKLTLNYIIKPNKSHPVMKKGTNKLRVHYKLEDRLISSAEIVIKKEEPNKKNSV